MILEAKLQRGKFITIIFIFLFYFKTFYLFRCLAVTGPAKGETKISDSLQTFLFRLRQALMAAFSRTLTKFEETVRTQRERRNDVNWNFCNWE